MNALMTSGEDQLIQRFSTALGEIGVTVEPVTQTGRAVNVLTSRRFEAVLLDCDLEGGMDLIEIVRQEPLNQRALVFAFVTGHAAAKEANRLGANFVLNKPINWEVAKRTLRAAYTMIIRERRKSIREKVRVPAQISAGKQQFEASISDLSETGIALQCSAPLNPQTHVELQFTLPSTNGVVQCTGKVAWCRNGLIGVEFLYLSGSSAQYIMGWLDKHSPRKGLRARDAMKNHALSWGF